MATNVSCPDRENFKRWCLDLKHLCNIINLKLIRVSLSLWLPVKLVGKEMHTETHTCTRQLIPHLLDMYFRMKLVHHVTIFIPYYWLKKEHKWAYQAVFPFHFILFWSSVLDAYQKMCMFLPKCSTTLLCIWQKLLFDMYILTYSKKCLTS